MSLGFPLSVRSRFFLFFFSVLEGGKGCVFAVFLAPFPEKGILDFIAHGSVTVDQLHPTKAFGPIAYLPGIPI